MLEGRCTSSRAVYMHLHAQVASRPDGVLRIRHSRVRLFEAGYTLTAMDASSPSVVACRSSRRTKMTETFESLFSDCSEPSFRRLKAKRRQAANSETWLKRLDRVQTLGSGSERSHYTESASYGHVGCVVSLLC
jgi:hypothetical protein